MCPGNHTWHNTARPALCEPTRPDRTCLHGHPHTTRHDWTRTEFGVSLYAQPERNLGFPWVLDLNEVTRQRRENWSHERVEGTRGVMNYHFWHCHVCPSTHARHDPTRPNEILGFHGCTTRTKARWSVAQTGRVNVQEAHGWSRLNIFYTATRSRAPTHGTARPDVTRLAQTHFHGHPHTTRPNPPERNLGFPSVHGPNEIWGFHGCTTRTKARGSVGKTGYMTV